MKTKSLILAFLFLLGYTQTTKAQIEVKVNPLGLLFSSPDLSVEGVIKENVSAELKFSYDSRDWENLNIKYKGYGATLLGKYYPKPKGMADGIYTGLFIKYKSLNLDLNTEAGNGSGTIRRLGPGVLAGYKFVSDSNVVFDINAGIGRMFMSRLEVTGDGSIADQELERDFNGRFPFKTTGLFSIAIGYRFGGDRS